MKSKNAPNNLWQLTLENTFSGSRLDKNVSADLVIIGGGFTGCSAALHAAEKGLKVHLLEARTVGYGGSGRNVGLVNAGLWLPPEEIQAQLGKVAADRLNQLLMGGPDRVFSVVEKYGINCDATRAGTLHCAHSRAGLSDLQERYRQLSAQGSVVELLDEQQVAARTGSDTFYGALFNPTAGTIQPLAYCHGLAQAASKAGAHIHEQSAALSITREGQSWLVQTKHGQVSAASILLATNAYHAHASGLAQPAMVPLYFFQMATEPLDARQSQSILAGGEGCWDTATIMSSFRRDAAGRLIIGGIGSLEHVGQGIHRYWASRKLRVLFPELAQQKLQYAWSGRIAMTSDHIPKLQMLGEHGLSVFGYSGRGIAPGTIMGALAVDALVSGQMSDIPLLPVDQHVESFQKVRQSYYEAGATLYHLLKSIKP